MKIKIEEFPNPDIIGIHVSKMITKEWITTFESPSYSEYKESDERSEELCFIAAALFAVEGISSVNIHPYELSIGKSPACDWEDLIPDVLHVVKYMIAKGESIEEKPRIIMTEEKRKELREQWKKEEREFGPFLMMAMISKDFLKELNANAFSLFYFNIRMLSSIRLTVPLT